MEYEIKTKKGKKKMFAACVHDLEKLVQFLNIPMTGFNRTPDLLLQKELKYKNENIFLEE